MASLLHEKLHMLRTDYALFYSYRWFAWVIAGLSLTLPGQNLATLPADAGLLVITAGLNIAATAFGTSYVRLARLRPWLLGFDVAISVALLWVSGGEVRPYFMYALSALILPGLLHGWRGGMIAACSFGLLDLATLTVLGFFNTQPLSFLALRDALPFAFAAIWAIFPRLRAAFADRWEATDSYAPPPAPLAIPPPPPTPTAPLFPVRTDSPPTTERISSSVTAEIPAVARLTAIHTTLPNSTQELRRTIYGFTPSLETHLPGALTELANHFGEYSAVAIQMIILGTVLPLTIAQQSLIVRIAQEALINIQQHAHAHNVLMTLHYTSQHVTLTVQDDGGGLLDGTYETPGMHTLRAIRYRLAELEGELEVTEGESGGVTLRAVVPYE